METDASLEHSDSASHSSSADDEDGHGTKIGVFVKVFGALCVLTAISFGIANSPLMNSKLIGWLMMMTVSCAKAFLVISFFMHLRWERSWKYVLTIPTMIMGILLVVALIPDIALRTRAYSQDRWRHATEATEGKIEAHGVEAHGSDASVQH